MPAAWRGFAERRRSLQTLVTRGDAQITTPSRPHLRQPPFDTKFEPARGPRERLNHLRTSARCDIRHDGNQWRPPFGTNPSLLDNLAQRLVRFHRQSQDLQRRPDFLETLKLCNKLELEHNLAALQFRARTSGPDCFGRSHFPVQ